MAKTAFKNDVIHAVRLVKDEKTFQDLKDKKDECEKLAARKRWREEEEEVERPLLADFIDSELD